MNCIKPIGLFDSGVGGLSVLRHVHQLLPDEQLIYVADSAYMPYGSQSPQLIRQRCHRMADFFVQHHAKAVVVACNTATAVAVESLRERYSLPIIGMEPAVKPAVESSRSGIIGVLATSGTLASEKFSRLVQRFDSHAEVIFQPGEGLVELVEAGELSGKRVRECLQQCLSPLLSRNIDVLVLGCTHYPFLAPLIREIVGEGISILDTGSAIASELKRQLQRTNALSEKRASGAVQFYSSGDVERLVPIIDQLWGARVDVRPFPEPFSKEGV